MGFIFIAVKVNFKLHEADMMITSTDSLMSVILVVGIFTAAGALLGALVQWLFS